MVVDEEEAAEREWEKGEESLREDAEEFTQLREEETDDEEGKGEGLLLYRSEIARMGSTLKTSTASHNPNSHKWKREGTETVEEEEEQEDNEGRAESGAEPEKKHEGDGELEESIEEEVEEEKEREAKEENENGDDSTVSESK